MVKPGCKRIPVDILTAWDVDLISDSADLLDRTAIEYHFVNHSMSMTTGASQFRSKVRVMALDSCRYVGSRVVGCGTCELTPIPSCVSNCLTRVSFQY